MTPIHPKYEKLTFYTLLILWLLPIWTVSYFLTGDGPCHLYNSKILLDWMQDKHIDMYRYFMNSNPHIAPNWLTNLIQVPLLAVFPVALAEKVFYTIYLLGFAFGFRFLIKQINPKALYLCSIGLIFAWHHIVFKGFSNNTLSIAVWFWTVGAWLKYKDASFGKTVIVLMPLALVSYLSHPMGFAYTIMMIACLLAGETIVQISLSGYKTAIKYFLHHALKLLVAYTPALILLLIFISHRSWSDEATGYNSEVWKNFILLPALVDFNYKEEKFAIVVSLFCFVLLAFTIFNRVRKKGFQKDDGLFLFVLLSFLTIIFPPASIMGGFDVPRRLIMLPFLAILFCAATMAPQRILQVGAIVLSFIISVGLLIIRLPIQWQTSAFTEEIVSCKEMIKPLSTVMTLNYDFDPHNIKGEKIIDAEWTNVHTDCYIGAGKPTILADNYELNTDYFPFTCKKETNFYYHSGKEGSGFDAQMPCVDFNNYKKRTGIQIDYVILSGMNEEQRKHEYTKDIMQQLDNDYEKIYTSPHGIAVLYRNKSGFKNPWLK
jgi:hypothetical protein